MSSSVIQPEQQSQASEASIRVVGKLAESKFPVFKIHWPERNSCYAMKVFKQSSKRSLAAYQNEKRFAVLKHTNLIKIETCIDNQITKCGSREFSTCLSVMELALGDFTDLANNIKMYQDEKMVRTYFKQLLDGVEYLHENGISHLDLKLENLLLGEDYNLKISDFDVSFFERDRKIRSLGTMNYRAPEIKDQVCVSPQKADIFSLGVILFCMMVGYHPYQEEKVIASYNLYDLLLSNPTEFMAAHEKLDSHVKNFPSEFKDFFLSMAKKDAEERPVISKLKQHSWLNGPVYSHQELKELIPKLLKSN